LFELSYIGSVGVNIGSGSTSAARYPIDLNATAADVQICLFQSGSAALFGFGANNSNMQIHCGTGGCNWFNGTTANGSLGTNILSVTSAGNCIVANNSLALSYFATGFSSVGLTGSGCKIHYDSGSSRGQIFSYNYTGGAFLHTTMGNNNIQMHTTGYVSINTSSMASSFPLAVFGTDTATRVGTFGWLSSAGTGVSVGFVGRAFSIY